MMLFTPLTILVAAAALLPSASAVPGKNTVSFDPETIFAPNSPVPTKESLAPCVDAAAALLGVSMNLKTDPEILKDILEEDMHLADSHEVLKLLGDDLHTPQPLGPMLSQVKEGITTLHPAVGATLCMALGDPNIVGVFSSPNLPMIRRSVHHMYLLEKIVVKASNDVTFMIKLKDHIRDTVKALSPHKSAIGHAFDLFKAAGIFGLAKSYTIDGAINDYAKFRTSGEISPSDEQGRKNGLTLNVLEATATDFVHGHFSNAKAGKILAWWHPDTIDVSGPNKRIRYVNTMDYARFYETWNLAFITANLEFPNLLYPKLLIPAVIKAGANDYLYHRVLALWLSINFYLMAYLTGKERVNIPGKEGLVDLWGKVNLRYAKYVRPDPVEEEGSMPDVNMDVDGTFIAF